MVASLAEVHLVKAVLEVLLEELHGLLVGEVARHLRLAHLHADLVHHELRVVRRLSGATVRGTRYAVRAVRPRLARDPDG